MIVDPGAGAIYLWFHLTMGFIVVVLWLFGYGAEPDDNDDDFSQKPTRRDEIDPDI